MKNYNFETGLKFMKIYKQSKNSDRYQYILPYYNFDTGFR